MLGKLIKHEFRATWRIMWPIFLGMLVLAVLARLTAPLMENSGGNGFLNLVCMLITTCFIFGMAALFIAPMILSAVRFKKSMLSDEGYLTMTLPAGTYQILGAKLIVSIVWYAAAAAVGLALMAMMVISWSDVGEIPMLMEHFFGAIKQADAKLMSDAAVVIAELFFCCVFAITATTLMLYTSLSMGYSFNKHKTLWTVLFIVVLFQVSEIITVRLGFGTLGSALWLTEGLAPVKSLLLMIIASQVVLSAVYFFVTGFFVTRKLNLE